MEVIKVLFVFGTRPEAIKMAPLMQQCLQDHSFETKICVTAQHREMLDQVLKAFGINPDYDLNIMQQNQDLYGITSTILLRIKDILIDCQPHFVFVHGDTTTTFSASLAAYYQQIPICHIEAGLRTNNMYNPWPEEGNRQLVGVLAKYHFVPSEASKENLINENKISDNVIVVGNTVIDALFLMLERIKLSEELSNKIIYNIKRYYPIQKFRNFLLVTSHRRENFGQGLFDICSAVKQLAINNPSIDIVYPIHLNPNVQEVIKNELSNISNIYITKHFDYESFVYLMQQSYFILTDSGGIQEEAPSLGKPVLLMRNTTERPEAVVAGGVKLVGTDVECIVNEAQTLIDDKELYRNMSTKQNPYGDGATSKKILNFIKEKCVY